MAAKRVRRDRRASGVPAPRTAVTVKLALSGETARRLATVATYRGLSQGELAEELIAAGLRPWRMPALVGDGADGAQAGEIRPDGGAGV